MEKIQRGDVEMSESIATAYVQIEPTFKGVQGKIASEMGSAGESGGQSFSSGFAKVLGGAGNVIGGFAKVTAAAVGAGSVAVAGLVKSATESYGEYEQLVGGVETLFGNAGVSLGDYMNQAKEQGLDAAEALATYNRNIEAQERVLNNAQNAYKTAGMSANDYMETVTSFSAALLQSVGGDTMKAAKAADTAIQDMSDNANKMGTSIESIQTAYQGFSKQNYTMLDNLKLGYGGTKAEMERLLADASKISGIKYDISSLSDVYDAIHVVQTEMGITGTTAKEASTTIQGSLSSLAASWENVLAGMGNSDANMSSLINTLVENAETFIGNVLPVVEQALTGVSTMIADLAPVIAEKIPGLLQTVLPMLLTSATQIVQTLGEGLLTAIPTLMPTITQLVLDIGTMIVQMLPQLIQVGAEVIIELSTGIAQALPELIPTIIEVILTISEYLIDNIDVLIDCAIQLMIGLATGLIQALPILIEKVPIIISKLLAAFLAAIPKLIEAAKQIITIIKNGLDQYLPQLLAKGQEIIQKLKDKLKEKVEQFKDIGRNIVEGIKQGIAEMWDSLMSWFTDKLSGMLDAVKSFFGIESPSKVFADEVGKMIPLGIAKGIEDGMGVVDKTMEAMTKDMVDLGVSATMTENLASAPAQGNTDSALLNLLSTYLPMIAQGVKDPVKLEGDMGRLFRAMQRESIRNTQLVGTNAVLSAI